MLIWSIFLTGVVALLFFMMYPRTDYIQTVETPIAQTAIVQFTTQHKNALNLALKAVEYAANRTDKTYTGSGTRTNTLTIPYPNFETLDKTEYLPDGLEQLDWGEDEKGNSLIKSRIVCIDYNTGATELSTEGKCSIGGYSRTDQETLDYGTRDYLITYAPKPADLDLVFPGWGSAWAEETKDMDTCGIVKDGKIQSPKCPGGLCDLSASENTTRLQNLITASGLLKNDKLEDNAFICISPIDHYAYDGVSITGKNDKMLAYYDGINNTWTGHNKDTTTWYDLSGNGNNAYFYEITTNGNTNATAALTSVSGWESNGYNFKGKPLDFLSLPVKFNPTVNDTKEQTIELIAELSSLEERLANSFFNGMGFYYLSQALAGSENFYFRVMIRDSTNTANRFPVSRYLSSAEINAGKAPLSVVWKTNYQSMALDYYFHGKKGNNKAYENKFQYKKYDREKTTRVGEKMRNSIGISYNGKDETGNTSYQKRIYVARLYNTRLTPAQIALNYQLDRKRFNIPKVTDNAGNDYTYLQNDGVAYIKTDFTPKAGSKAYIKTKVMKTSGAQDYGGTAARDLGSYSYFAPFITSGSTVGYYFNSYHTDTGQTVSTGNVIESTLTVNTAGTSADVEYNNLTNGTSYTKTQTGSINTSNDIYLFAGHGKDGASEPATAKIARYTIWQDDEWQHDFIPAEDPFGRPAMYDKILGKFFYNAASSGEFTLTTD